MNKITKFVNEIKSEKEESFSLTLNENDNYSFYLRENENARLNLLIDAKDIKNANIEFNLKDDSTLTLVYNIVGENSSLNFVCNLHSNASLIIFSSDSLNGESVSNKTFNLEGKSANLKAYEYTITSSSSSLKGDFIVNHDSPNTTSSSKLVQVAKDSSLIDKKATSSIKKGMKDSNANEKIKGIILGNGAHIISKPILIIDFDDVHASHGCAIGSLDDNEIYYLMTRGLSKEDATKIICHSFITPILDIVKDEEYKKIITPILEESFGGEKNV